MDWIDERLGQRTATGLWFDTVSGHLAGQDVSELRPLEPPRVVPYDEATPQLQLSLTYACNMNCSYCSFRARMEADGRPLSMNMDIALDAVDFFAREIKEHVRHARIDFGLTGETFLRHKIHQTLKDEIKIRTAMLGLRAVSVGPNTTNGTLSEDVNIDTSMGPPQDISCDGPREVHDAVRPYVDGKGSYDDLLPLIKKVLCRHPEIGVTAVITSRCTDIVKIFRHLYDELGFRSLYLKPVNLAYDDPDGLNPRTVAAFCGGYTDFIDFLIDQNPEDKLRYLASLNAEDYFMRFFYRIVNRTRNIYRCGAGKSGAYVDTEGTLYPCAHFIGKTGYDIGNIYDGFDERRRDAYRKLTVDSREPCKSCWAKYVCGGGCYYQAVLANGSIEQPDEAKCTLILHLVREAIRLYEHLALSEPDVLAALNIPVHLAEDVENGLPDDYYRPVSSLRGAGEKHEESLNVLTRQHLDGSIPTVDRTLGLRMTLRRGRLDVAFEPSEGVQLRSVEIWVIDLEKDPVFLKDLPAFSHDVFGQKIVWMPDGKFVLARGAMEGSFREIPFNKPKQCELKHGDGAEFLNGWNASFDFNALIGCDLGKIGLNIVCYLQDGRMARLVRAEPFAIFEAGVEGSLSLCTPQWLTPQHREHLNASPYANMISLTEWTGLQQNVC